MAAQSLGSVKVLVQPLKFLFARAMEHDSPKLLFRQVCEYLSSSMLVRPGIVKILDRVAAARERAREETWTRVAPLLTLRRQAELDEMLAVDPVLGRTRLSWLGSGSLTVPPRGWAIESDSPVIFRRSELTHPLVEPQRGGTLDAVRALINLPEEDYRLAIGWVVAAYLTGIPHPILLVQGEQGTAKSNLIRTLLALIDPQPAADRTPPKDNREWAIFARASWAFSYDNITDIPGWLSNALRKGVTGDAVLQRVLHSDDDIGVYSFQRVIALTTIAIRHEVAGDLADRILLVEPEVIEKRRTETEITAARAAALPGALGAVLDLVAGVLRELPGTTVDNAPQMADFAKVLAALDTVTGWETLASYRAKVATLALSLIEGNTFAYAIYRLATLPSPGGLDPGPWEGTASELLGTLRRI